MTRKLELVNDDLSTSLHRSADDSLSSSSSLKRSDSLSSDSAASTTFSNQVAASEISLNNKETEESTFSSCSHEATQVAATAALRTSLKETTANKQAVRELSAQSNGQHVASSSNNNNNNSGTASSGCSSRVKTRKSKQHHKSEKKANKNSILTNMAKGKIVTSFDELCHLKARSRTPIDIHQAQALTTTTANSPPKAVTAVYASTSINTSTGGGKGVYRSSESISQESAKIYAEAKNFLQRTSHKSFPIAGVINGYQ